MLEEPRSEGHAQVKSVPRTVVCSKCAGDKLEKLNDSRLKDKLGGVDDKLGGLEKLVDSKFKGVEHLKTRQAPAVSLPLSPPMPPEAPPKGWLWWRSPPG